VIRGGLIALFIGIALVIGLVVYQGASEVGSAIAATGWGLLLVIVARMVPIALDGLVWRLLFHPAHLPRVVDVLWVRWVGEAVNTLLPAFQVGGALVRSRLMIMLGTPGRVAGASVVVDLTLSTLTQLLFTLVGVGLLLAKYGDSYIANGASAGVVLGLVLVGGFFISQRRGLFSWLTGRLSRIAKGRDWVGLVGGAEALDNAILDLYRRRWALTANSAGQLVAWSLGAAEIWIAL